MIVEIKDLNKDYIQGKMPVHILKGVNLSVDKGEYIEQDTANDISDKSAVYRTVRK